MTTWFWIVPVFRQKSCRAKFDLIFLIDAVAVGCRETRNRNTNTKTCADSNGHLFKHLHKTHRILQAKILQGDVGAWIEMMPTGLGI